MQAFGTSDSTTFLLLEISHSRMELVDRSVASLVSMMLSSQDELDGALKRASGSVAHHSTQALMAQVVGLPVPAIIMAFRESLLVLSTSITAQSIWCNLPSLYSIRGGELGASNGIIACPLRMPSSLMCKLPVAIFFSFYKQSVV